MDERSNGTVDISNRVFCTDEYRPNVYLSLCKRSKGFLDVSITFQRNVYRNANTRMRETSGFYRIVTVMFSHFSRRSRVSICFRCHLNGNKGKLG